MLDESRNTLTPSNMMRMLSMVGCTEITLLPTGRILATYCNKPIRVSTTGEVTDIRKRLLFKAEDALDIWNNFVYDTGHMNRDS